MKVIVKAGELVVTIEDGDKIDCGGVYRGDPVVFHKTLAGHELKKIRIKETKTIKKKEKRTIRKRLIKRKRFKG